MFSFKRKNKRQKITCSYCRNDVYKDDAFVLEYKAADGNGEMHLCSSCAETLDHIIEKRDYL